MKLTNHLKKYDNLIFPAIGFYLIYIYTRYSGIGISPDSIMYISTARSVSTNGTLYIYAHSPIADFPAFYPFFLGCIQFITRIDPVTFAPFLNGLLYAAVIFLSGWIMQRFTVQSLLYKWMVLIAIALSPVMLLIYSYVWSETLFILLILLFFIAYRHYVAKRTITALLIAAIIASFSSITRYAGITVIGTGGLLLLLDRNLIPKKKITHILLYGVTACSLLLLNFLRNAWLTKHITGPREPSVTPFFKNVYYLGTVLCEWFNMQEKFYYLALPIALFILTAVICLFFYNTITRKTDCYEHIALTFTIVYALFMVVSATFSRYQQLDSRLLAPLFIPLLWSCTYWVVKAIKKIRVYKAKRTTAWLAFALTLSVFSYNELFADSVRYDSESGYGIPGYTDDAWNKSPFVDFLKHHKGIYKPGIPIYTNADEAVYWASGIISQPLPHVYFKQHIRYFFAIKHYYLVWFNNYQNDELIDLNDILKRQKLVKLYEFEDGAIYEYSSEP